MPTTTQRVTYTLIHLVFIITLSWRHFYPPPFMEWGLRLQRLSVCPRSHTRKQNERGTASFPMSVLCARPEFLLPCTALPTCVPATVHVHIHPLARASHAGALEESVHQACISKASSWHRTYCAHGRTQP